MLKSSQKIDTILSLVEKYDLYEDDVKSLNNEIDLVLMNLEDIESLTKNLERELGINPITASRLVDDINTQIFAPIKNSLQKIQQERKDQEKETRVFEVLESQKTPTTPNQPPRPPINRITEVKRADIQPPANLPMLQEEHELTVQKTQPVAPTQPQLPKTFGESSRPQNITPTAKPAEQFFVSRPKPSNIIEAKLAGSFNMPQEKLNVSAPKPAQTQNSAPVTRKADPYREPVE